VPTDAPCVFDAGAIIAYLQDEPGAGEVRELLETQRCLVHVINLCEVYYDLMRRSGQEVADGLESVITAAGFEIHSALPTTLWQQAGRLKAEMRRISLADCFAIAFALGEQGTCVTTDHHELDPVAAAGLCPIRFIR
jgi:uncharacterized protein with PIN domain